MLKVKMNNNNSNCKHNMIKYLPPSNNQIQWGMFISGVGYQYTETGSEYPVKGHPREYTFNPERGRTIEEYAIVYITKGSGMFTSVYSGVKKLEQGDIFFIFPGQWHSYHPDVKTGWDEYWITFHGNYCNNILENLVNKNNPIFHIGMNEQIVKMFREMQDCAKSQLAGFQQVLCGTLLHIIGLIYFISQNQVFEAKDTQRIQEACVLMQENIYNKVKPENIAQSLNMSYSSFRKLFKHYTGLAPHQYMLQLKLEKTKELLGSTDLPIQDIATELGFESADYFSFFFRSKTGINPLSYRKEIEAQREKAEKF